MARICVLTQDLKLGGALTKLTTFLRYAATRNHRCDLFFPVVNEYTEKDANLLKSTGVLDGFCPIFVPEKVPHFIRGAIFSKRCVLTEKYDAYHFVGASMYFSLPFVTNNVSFVASVANPVVIERKTQPRKKFRHYYLYNPLTEYMINRQEALCGAKATCVIAETRFNAYNLQSELCIPDEKIHIIPNPVDTDIFRPDRCVVTPKRYILSVSRLDREKDISTLLRAFKLVYERIPDVTLRIAGDGKEKQNLEREVKSLGLELSVVFLGNLRGEELVQQYCGAFLFAFSSPQEAFGNVYIEAMACGLPIISTDSGAVRDHIEHGRTGFIVSPYDSKALGEFIIKLLEDPDLAAKMGQSNRNRAIEHYSFEIFYKRMDSIYKSVFGI